MRLLFDANLSPRLVASLRDLYPDCAHVFDCGGIHRDDLAIWRYARASSYVIITQDSDFQSMSMLRGAPPKVVLLRAGNVGTQEIANILRIRHTDLVWFEADPLTSLLIVS